MTEKSADEVFKWNTTDVKTWAKLKHLSDNVIYCIEREGVDGQVLLTLTENDIRDFRFRMNYKLSFGELKKLWLMVHALQTQNSPQVQKSQAFTSPHGISINSASEANLLSQESVDSSPVHRHLRSSAVSDGPICTCSFVHSRTDCDISPPLSIDGRATHIPQELFKTAISLAYSFAVTWITSFVMVIVHERVPDMKRYPPLPDIFLDNVPHIPWAFHMCELTGTLLFSVWAFVIIFHKYRSVLLRRFFALAGTVFLLRCVTMLITSLSVPGAHLQCNQSDYAFDDTIITFGEALEKRIFRAYTIWAGLGMSIQGVRTCGDYMFSGHTVALTLMNFFITEYTPRNLYFLHTLSWLLNMFGIFFILAAHEHYSIDVFVAFYITSRLFLYYHTLANNQALMSHDSTRTRVWFPMFSYFESSVDGIIPNEYDTIDELKHNIFHFFSTVINMIKYAVTNLWHEIMHIREITTSKSTPTVSTSKSTSKINPQLSTSEQTIKEKSKIQKKYIEVPQSNDKIDDNEERNTLDFSSTLNDYEDDQTENSNRIVGNVQSKISLTNDTDFKQSDTKFILDDYNHTVTRLKDNRRIDEEMDERSVDDLKQDGSELRSKRKMFAKDKLAQIADGPTLDILENNLENTTTNSKQIQVPPIEQLVQQKSTTTASKAISEEEEKTKMPPKEEIKAFISENLVQQKSIRLKLDNDDNDNSSTSDA